MAMPRPCKKCGARFQPAAGRRTLCEKCLKEVKNVNFIKLICHRRGIGLENLKKNW